MEWMGDDGFGSRRGGDGRRSTLTGRHANFPPRPRIITGGVPAPDQKPPPPILPRYVVYRPSFSEFNDVNELSAAPFVYVYNKPGVGIHDQ